jgi:hypothetical protein
LQVLLTLVLNHRRLVVLAAPLHPTIVAPRPLTLRLLVMIIYFLPFAPVVIVAELGKRNVTASAHAVAALRNI